MVVFDDSLDEAASYGKDMLALDTALDDLARMSPRQAMLVESRFFGGLDVSETAALCWRFPRPPCCATGARPRRGWRNELRPRGLTAALQAEIEMESARWDRIQTLFHEAADLPERERQTFLQECLRRRRCA